MKLFRASIILLAGLGCLGSVMASNPPIEDSNQSDEIRLSEMVRDFFANPAPSATTAKRTSGVASALLGVISLAYLDKQKGDLNNVQSSALGTAMSSSAGGVALYLNADGKEGRQKMAAARAGTSSSDSEWKIKKSPAYGALMASLGSERSAEFISDLKAGWAIPQLLEKYLTADQSVDAKAALEDEKKEWEATFKKHPELAHFQDKINPIMVERVFLRTLKKSLPENDQNYVDYVLDQQREKFMAMMRGDSGAMPHAPRNEGTPAPSFGRRTH